MLDLVPHLLVAHRATIALDAETARTGEHDLRPDFDVQLERQRLSLVEVDVLDARLPGGVNLLALENFLVCVVEQAVERFLPDGGPKRLRMIAAGALPGRNPGRRTFDA